ncbi:hypothetical protein [uncultured Bacteroides sp.]|uniref:hypothetical protein n=1 Tax=uncultured Bacteroides sp. TaxID=162156 RepID=UPI0025E531ED|nr:hypothetical protein [uncultured Bacteroides sp.]
MKKNTLRMIYLALLIALPFGKIAGQEHKIPVVVITDLYHPFQDPGDNMDLIMGFGLPDVDLKAVLLDITDAFRKPIADHPTLWKDPRGPREAGIIPVEQLSYIFNKKVPYGIGPLSMMKSEEDKMDYLPPYEQEAIHILLKVLNESKEPIEVLSFGSARILAVAYNRNPQLLKKKIHKIHLSAGTASSNYEPGSDAGANSIPGGEWNVALDVFAFNRILKSDLPVAIYPCAGKDGGFIKDCNNTYWQLPDMEFTKQMNPQLQHYLSFAFNQKLQVDFLRAMDADYPTNIDISSYPKPFHVWESAIWLNATQKAIICNSKGEYRLVKRSKVGKRDRVIGNELRYCTFDEIRDDGRFRFSYTDKTSGCKEMYYRADMEENEKALQKVIPELYISISPNN